MIKIPFSYGFSATALTCLILITLSFPALAINKTAATQETAVFAGGCFWGVHAVFKHVKGVTEAVSGYTGGNAKPQIMKRSATGTADMRKRYASASTRLRFPTNNC